MTKKMHFLLMGLAVVSFLLVGCKKELPTSADAPSGAIVLTQGSDWVLGDVFVAVSNGSYQVYDNSGNYKETISDGLGGYTTGCAFNPPLDKLYTTNFGATKVIVYDNAHPHTILQTIDTGFTSPSGHSESIVFAANGDFYVGHPDGNQDIHRYNAAGALQQTYNVAVERRGSDWMDLGTDQQTMFYTSEGGRIMRYDIPGDAQLSDFANIGGISYALRLLPPGDGTGGLLVANTYDIKRLDGSGAVIQAYDITGEDTWFALNLDPNGTSFWSGNYGSSNFYRFNIASGAVEVGGINTGTTSNTLYGICVKGELTAGLCEPVEDPDVRTQGFWKRVCKGPHPSGEHENLPGYVDCVNDYTTFWDVNDVNVLCDRLKPNPKNDKCEQAEAQFMALLLNFCSGRVAECNCVDDLNLGETTVGEAAYYINGLLSDGRTREDCVLAQAIADGINSGETLVTCP